MKQMMKNWNFRLVVAALMPIVIAALSLTISCDFGLTDNDQDNELEKLPPITQTGENTFGCLVNGKAFVVKNTSKQVAIFQQGQLQFGASLDEKDTDESLSMNLVDPLKENQNYFFDGKNFYAGYTLRVGTSYCIYEYNETFSGQVSFSQIDRTNFIISGTFEFSTVTEDCDTIRITDGRFDMQYIP